MLPSLPEIIEIEYKIIFNIIDLTLKLMIRQETSNLRSKFSEWSVWTKSDKRRDGWERITFLNMSVTRIIYGYKNICRAIEVEENLMCFHRHSLRGISMALRPFPRITSYNKKYSQGNCLWNEIFPLNFPFARLHFSRIWNLCSHTWHSFEIPHIPRP